MSHQNKENCLPKARKDSGSEIESPCFSGFEVGLDRHGSFEKLQYRRGWFEVYQVPRLSKLVLESAVSLSVGGFPEGKMAAHSHQKAPPTY
ncbi:hypothetical protein [Ruegeria sp. HKCCD6604]|uniref:hypothetical protein n=1 Tax=Ruegeria sp. HKCCD6604 TaxID=2683000 RepID=UPI001490E273|nr:hypothetical protein [Ruegeria sp. HKCCD6604]NOC94520.1 hypothetical protein [Ruegeria sp. HKCCD6604]